MAVSQLKKLILKPTKAPDTPVAPVSYSQQYTDQMANSLRLYFAQIDNSIYGLINNAGLATVSALLNGTSGAITYSILNADTLTKNGTGDYTLTFQYNLSTTQYAPQITLGGLGYAVVVTPGVASIQFRTYNTSAVLTDFSYISLTIFGGGLT